MQLHDVALRWQLNGKLPNKIIQRLQKLERSGIYCTVRESHLFIKLNLRTCILYATGLTVLQSYIRNQSDDKGRYALSMKQGIYRHQTPPRYRNVVSGRP